MDVVVGLGPLVTRTPIEDEEVARTHLANDEEDAASRDIPGEGEAETSPEKATTRLAVVSQAELRPET
jgi:hypothetical protein